MRTLFLAVLFLTTSFLAPTVASAQVAEVATIAGATAASSLIADVKEGMSQIINEAESAFSRQAFDARSHAVVILQQADFIAQSVIGKTFQQLNETERKFFTDAKVLISKWEKGSRNIARDLESLASTMEEAVSRLPGGDKRPLVKKAMPSFFSAAQTDGSFFVSISGTRIGGGEPTLAFGANGCRRVAKTDRDIKFECSAKIFAGISKPTARSGKLLVADSKSLVDWVLFRTPQPVAYDVGIIGVPPELGSFAVTATVASQVQETQERSFYFNLMNAHCIGTRELLEPINASAGWAIVESSIRVGDPGLSIASGATGPTPRSITSTGFQVYGKAVNSGNCIRVLGQTVSRDARGWSRGTIHWTEVRNVEREDVQPVANGGIVWSSDNAFTLPPNSRGFMVSIKHFDGTVRVVTAAGDFPWYEVDYDQNTRVVVIRPNSLTESLGS